MIGTSYGRYNLHLGGDRLGERLNVKYKEHLDEEDILKELDLLFGAYANERINGEGFGDFMIRKIVFAGEGELIVKEMYDACVQGCPDGELTIGCNPIKDEGYLWDMVGAIAKGK